MATDDALIAPDGARERREGEPAFANTLLPYLLARASHVVSAAFYARLKRDGIPVRRWRLLGLLWDGDALSIGALSRGILIEQSSTTRLVDRAVADGLVEKREDAHDRRRVLVTITPKGRRYIASVVADARRADDAIAAAIDAAAEPGAAERLKSELRGLLAQLDPAMRPDGG